ncbi:MAG TPA: hypothetical protein VNW92_15545 [Polyangiaceae bacterium]|nr:hypothetical protein [Polyangiaceae bacterium]
MDLCGVAWRSHFYQRVDGVSGNVRIRAQSSDRVGTVSCGDAAHEHDEGLATSTKVPRKSALSNSFENARLFSECGLSNQRLSDLLSHRPGLALDVVPSALTRKTGYGQVG